MHSGYQTLPGEVEGLFPTHKWFEKIKEHVDFKGRNLIDFGSCDGVISILAKMAGADKVIGIEQEIEKIEASKELARGLEIEWLHEDIKKGFATEGDIAIFSMIIHWIGKKETERQVPAFKTVIYIYRQANDAYDHPDNGQWFPSQNELNFFMKGYRNVHTEDLMEQDNNKKIVLSIYERVVPKG